MFRITIKPVIHRTSIRSTILVFCLLITALFSLPSALSAAEFSSNIVKPKQIYTYEVMTRDIQALAKQYPDLIRYSSAGKSEYDRDLWLMEVGRGPVNVLLNGSHHAREWITTALLMEMTENMAISDRKDAKWGDYQIRDLLDHVTFQIVPMVNPDGVTLQQKGLDAFPKTVHAALLKMNGGSSNFKRWKANAKGIDLNRQYPADWKNIKNASSAPYYMNYKGKKPLEAKETQTMVKLATALKPAIAVSYHTSGEILYWNYKTLAKNLKRDQAFATAYSKMTGYRMVKPVAQPSGGGFTDWFIENFGQPALTPELSPYAGERDVPLSNWERIWKLHKADPWLIGTTAVQIEMDKLQAEKATGWIELTKEMTAYKSPMLDALTLGKLVIGNYEVTRSKGSWIEIKSNGLRYWISDLYSRKLSAKEIAELLKPLEEPEETIKPEEPDDQIDPEIIGPPKEEVENLPTEVEGTLTIPEQLNTPVE
ncbi:g-D-glutamyl-meso-diaminopimelate peptidase [Paenibacillus sp. DS2015]|uniref:M14 family zinc carboxypeptidase n=1 Tax=Paenibacillus sp. DS2015 TaxID=3373917 RepID=UPI003D1CB7A4